MGKIIKDGTKISCQNCGREYIKDRKKGHKGTICNSCSSRRKESSYKEKIFTIIGDKCCRCSYNKCKEAIEYHHVKDKSFTISQAFTNLPFSSLEKEAMKCIPLCSNCHREFHYKLWDYKDLDNDNLKDYQKELIRGVILVGTKQEEILDS